MTVSTFGVLAGLMGGVGLCLLLWCLARRRITLEERIAPYLTARSPASRLLAPARPHTALVPLEKLVAPAMKDVGQLLERLGSTTGSVRRRLLLAGSRASVEQFRIEQLVWGSVGLAVGLLGVSVLVTVRHVGLLASIFLVLLSAVIGAVARDQVLSRGAKLRQRRLLNELPDIAELLALSVAAGEGVLGALQRVSVSTTGALAHEVQLTLAEAHSGIPLAEALEGMARRTDVGAVARFAEGIAGALERGAPLAEVLRAQAQDAREVVRRALMETGGKKEISMMIPVVFLLLPLTVLFALFPGLAALDLGT